MSLLITTVIIILGSLLGRHLFKYWFNHLTLYCIVLGGAIFLYELKLIPYVEVTPFTWMILSTSFLSFLMGIITIISARNVFSTNPTQIIKSDASLKIFADDGRTLKYIIILFSLVTLYSAVEYWMILIKQFGSIPAVLINAKVVYRLNIEAEIKGNTPYIFLVGFAAVFFAGLYTAYKGKFSILTFIPLIGIILKDLAGAGRAAMLLALVEFVITFFLFRHLLNSDFKMRFQFSRFNAVVASLVLVFLFVGSASLVKASRNITGKAEEYSGATKTLRQLEGNFIISPSIYLYASSDIGVLSKYFNSNGENTRFGENTFMTLYIFMSKLGIIERPNEFQKGYYIPMWTNTGTYLRELHADFGIAGTLLGPYLIGFLITWLWFKFYEGKNIFVFAFLVFLIIIVVFSFFVMATRILYWSTGLAIILISIPAIEKLAVLNAKR